MMKSKVRIGSILLVAVLFLMFCFGLSATLPELRAQPSTNVGLDRPVEGYLSPLIAGQFNIGGLGVRSEQSTCGGLMKFLDGVFVFDFLEEPPISFVNLFQFSEQKSY